MHCNNKWAIRACLIASLTITPAQIPHASALPVNTVPSSAPSEEPLARIKKLVVYDGKKTTKTKDVTDAQVTVIRKGRRVPVTCPMDLFAGDVVTTLANRGLIVISLDVDSQQSKRVIVGRNTQFQIQGRASVFSQFGKILLTLKGSLRVETPTASLAIDSTEFEVATATDGSTKVLVLEGAVKVTTGNTSRTGAVAGPASVLGAGPIAKVKRGSISNSRAPVSVPKTKRSQATRARRPAGTGKSVAGRSSTQLVARLGEIAISGRVVRKKLKVAQSQVSSTLDWTNGVILAGQPTYSTKKMIPHLASSEERARTFGEARFNATWKQQAGSYETLGNIYSDWEDGAEAIKAYDNALKIDRFKKVSPALLTNLAEAYRIDGQLADAEQRIQQALSLHGQYAPALNAQGNIKFDAAAIALDRGELGRASALLEEARGSYQRSYRAVSGQSEVARAVAQANVGESHLATGEIAQKEKRLRDAEDEYAAAAKAFDSAKKLDPKYPFSTTGLGEAFRGQGVIAQSRGDNSRANQAFRRAETQFMEALKQTGDLVAAYVGLGNVYQNQGRDQEAIESYKRAIEFHPDQPAPYYALAVLLEQTNPQEAAGYFRSYLQSEHQALKEGQKGAHAQEVATGKSQFVTVPDLRNMLEDQARIVGAENRGLKIRFVVAETSDAPPGTIIAQDVPPGTRVKEGTEVSFTIAARPALVSVPQLSGMLLSEAERVVKQNGLALGRVDYEQTGKYKEGVIISQAPTAGQSVAPGTSVSVVVAARPSLVTVPELLNLTLDSAREQLARNNLTLAKPNYSETDKYKEGTIISQSPSPGQSVSPGSSVTVYVAARLSPVNVPDLRRIDLSRAYDQLAQQTGGRLKIGNVDKKQTSEYKEGIIIDQTPAPGQAVAPGTPIDVVVAVRPSLVAVPDLLNLTLYSARDQLARNNLTLGKFNYEETDKYKEGTVISQFPTSGESVSPGSSVNVVLAAAPSARVAQIKVPDLTRMTLNRATDELVKQTSGGLAVGRVDYEPTNNYKEGTIISQAPTAGQIVAPGTQVDVVVAARPSLVTVPELLNLTLDSARDQLARNNLTLGKFNYEETDKYKEGTVISQSPRSGESVSPGSSVNVVLAAAPSARVAQIKVPDLTGMTLSRAKQELAQQPGDLTVGMVVYEQSSKYKEGSIIRQFPAAGLVVPQSFSVTVFVAARPSLPGTVVVPNVIKQRESDAITMIKDAGLIPEVVDRREPQKPPQKEQQREYYVVKQEPEGGTEVKRGATVRLWLQAR